MDPEVSLLLHCADWKGLRKCQVQVELSERYNRQTDPALEDHIEKLWKERLAKEPWIFNGAKFRLHSFSLACDKNFEADDACIKNYKENLVEINSKEEDTFTAINACIGDKATALPSKESQRQEECVLILRLGLTSYKDYLGTNWSAQAEELCRRGEVEFGDPLLFLAQPLGVGAVLSTMDDQIVFIRRSHRVAEAGGLLDIPGGHPEPKVVCENLGLKICEDKISMVMLSPVAVVTELYSSVCAEIRDEINIPLKFLGEPLLIGIALNHTSAGRPSAEFYISQKVVPERWC
ncbi:uridine diphosphate glucose pyrophosphatase NUDT22 isoform X2 [Boleophthalmus pectinirostris]|uniref:uridine diphosphate glucose pyrophosphatase NUDT22 isoform X2 n=1 Tax=Boleophthalmus pectinirostris TaxID=150288 RepID=UPI002432A067|nr:uridine diphosphate glucose pyrophosphatase NUDT22 isoform X2 [Boleophthalmus pectinirostris]